MSIETTLTNDVGWCASYDGQHVIEGCYSESSALRALADWLDKKVSSCEGHPWPDEVHSHMNKLFGKDSN